MCVTAANSIQMLLSNLDCDGTPLHAPSPHELLVLAINYGLAHSYMHTQHQGQGSACGSEALSPV